MIITLEDYKTYTGSKNPAHDEKLQFIVDFVNTFITNYCNSTFGLKQSLNVPLTSNDGLEVLLPNFPVVSVEELRINGVVADPSTYFVDQEEGTIVALGSLPTSRFALSVDYSYWYPEVPYDLMLSALEFVTHLHKREFTGSRSLGNGETADYESSEILPSQVRMALNLYRLV